MTVCVVAEYPWKRISDWTILGPPGLIVCSDTRASAPNHQPLRWLFQKQRFTARNIFVTYTSSHGAATTLAIDEALGSRTVARFGRSLKAAHAKYGGLTEMLAIVWPGTAQPEVLELMPPDYRPRHRTGIIGIGDHGTLAWFRENFGEDPTPDLPKQLPPDVIERFARHLNARVSLPPLRFTIEDAAIKVAAAVAVGIDQVGGATVGLPLQVTTISNGVVRHLDLAMSSAIQDWTAVTTDAGKTTLPRVRIARLPTPTARRTAVQLFD